MSRRHALLAALLGLGCERAHAQTVTPVAPRAASPRPPAPHRPTPPALTVSISALAVPGFGDAVLSVPDDARAHPVVVAAHGSDDKPEWQCGAWSQLVRGRAFVLCPRGVARRDSPSPADVRFTYRDGVALGREVDAGLAALRATYGARVAPGPIVYAGFSLGAILGTAYLRRTREAVAAAVMVEGGHDGWTAGSARAFAQRGGRAVLFGCGQGGCANDARRAAARMRGARVETAVTLAPRAGHSYGGVVWVTMREAFERLVAPALDR